MGGLPATFFESYLRRVARGNLVFRCGRAGSIDRRPLK
jgi:hypothetical protein